MDALILVDLQNDFCAGGALAVPDGDAVVEVANRLLPRFSLIIATQDNHPPTHLSFAQNHAGKNAYELIDLDGLPQVLWPVHCVAGTPGAAFHPKLDTARITRVFPKGTDARIDSYSGFFDNGHRKATGLGDYLKQQGVTRVYVLGLATDYCVKWTALDALRLGFEVHLIEDACRGVGLSRTTFPRPSPSCAPRACTSSHRSSLRPPSPRCTTSEMSSEIEPPSGAELRALLTKRPAPGRVVWIGVRPDRGLPMRVLQEATLLTDRGIEGDRSSARSPGGKRQVSLIQAEHFPVIASFVGHERIEPALFRRNLVVQGINLIGLRASAFRIGAVLFRGNGFCEPCSKMEQALGKGGYNAMRGHGGILARVVRGGVIRLGDEVDFWTEPLP